MSTCHIQCCPRHAYLKAQCVTFTGVKYSFINIKPPKVVWTHKQDKNGTKYVKVNDTVPLNEDLTTCKVKKKKPTDREVQRSDSSGRTLRLLVSKNTFEKQEKSTTKTSPLKKPTDKVVKAHRDVNCKIFKRNPVSLCVVSHCVQRNPTLQSVSFG